MPALPAFTVPYKTVEAALARMHNVPADGVAAFRSRLGALQRGGLLGAESQPGKGRKLDYGIDQFRRLVLAVELTQAGLGPSVILRLVRARESWEKLNGIISRAERANDNPGPDDVVLILLVDLMFDETSPAINHTTRNKLRQHIELVFNNERLGARLLLINLSAQMRKFHDALSHFHLQSDRTVEAALAPKATPRRRR